MRSSAVGEAARADAVARVTPFARPTAFPLGDRPFVAVTFLGATLFVSPLRAVAWRPVALPPDLVVGADAPIDRAFAGVFAGVLAGGLAVGAPRPADPRPADPRPADPRPVPAASTDRFAEPALTAGVDFFALTCFFALGCLLALCCCFAVPEPFAAVVFLAVVFLAVADFPAVMAPRPVDAFRADTPVAARPRVPASPLTGRDGFFGAADFRASLVLLALARPRLAEDFFVTGAFLATGVSFAMGAFLAAAVFAAAVFAAAVFATAVFVAVGVFLAIGAAFGAAFAAGAFLAAEVLLATGSIFACRDFFAARASLASGAFAVAAAFRAAARPCGAATPEATEPTEATGTAEAAAPPRASPGIPASA